MNLQRHHVAAFCESLIECGWLLAIIATPLYFNIYSFRVFEPDKASLLRSIALLVVAAWLIEWLCVPRRGLGNPRRMLQAVGRHPLAAPVLMIVLTEAVATTFSVVPRVSLLGSYVRLQGTLTTLAYLILFAAAAAHVHRPDQVKRMLSAVALSSLPIALYALVQYLGLDPLAPWDLDVRVRPPANLGNPVFLGGYLAMSTVVVLGLLTARLRRLSGEHTGGILRVGITLAYGVVFGLDLVAIVLTQSRGPLLALYIGLVCYLFLATTVPSAKRFAIAALLILIVAVPGVLGLIAVRAGTREQVQTQAGRWTTAFDTRNGSVGVRVAIWNGVIALVTSRTPLELPDGRRDAWHAIRPIFGYGPESLAVTFRINARPELARLEGRPVYADRAHNETLDMLATTGILGVTSYLWLFAAIVWRGLTTLGLLDSRRSRWRLMWLVLTSGVVMGVVLAAWGGVALLVVAIPLGAAFGLLSYFALSFLPGCSRTAVRHPLAPEASLVVISLLAATIAHFVEISFGVATVATRTYFWLFAALLALDGTTMGPAVGTNASFEVPRAQNPEFGATRWKEAASAGLLVAVALATLAHDYFVFDVRTARWGRLFVEGSATPSGDPSWIALGLFAGTWLVGSLLVLETVETLSRKKVGLAAWLVPGLSLLLGSLCWIERGVELNGIAQIAPTDFASMLALGERITRLSDNYGIMLVVLVFALASALLAIRISMNVPSQRVVHARCTVWDVCKFSVVAVVTLWLVQIVSLRPIQADTLYNIGRQLAPDRRGLAIGLYRQAAAVAFYEDQYAFAFERASSR